MKSWYQPALAAFCRFFLEWKFLKGGSEKTDMVSALSESARRYELVEEVCLRRGQRSCRIVRKYVDAPDA